MIGKRSVDPAPAKLALRSEPRSISRHWGSSSVLAVPIITMDYVSLDLSCTLRLADATRSRHTPRFVFSEVEAAVLVSNLERCEKSIKRGLAFSPPVIVQDDWDALALMTSARSLTYSVCVGIGRRRALTTWLPILPAYHHFGRESWWHGQAPGWPMTNTALFDVGRGLSVGTLCPSMQLMKAL